MCADPCVIAASSFPGYDPIAAVVASGASVVWHSTDVTHVTRDQSVGSSSACFDVVHAEGEDSPPVLFAIEDGVLTATVDGDTTTCTSAVGSAQAGFALAYFCTIHPTMRATLVVTN